MLRTRVADVWERSQSPKPRGLGANRECQERKGLRNAGRRTARGGAGARLGERDIRRRFEESDQTGLRNLG